MTEPTPNGQRSGIVTRYLAAGIDLAAILAILVGTGIGWVAVVWILNPGTIPRAPSLALVLVAYEVLGTLYLTAGWATTGRSFGQQIMGLRVTTTRGNRLPPVRAVVRAAATLFFPIGVLWAAVSPRQVSIQDIVLRTCVIYDWTVKPTVDVVSPTSHLP
jgi:uncharacterized RDD family membrane protein YckC